MKIEERLVELGVELPEPSAPGANYVLPYDVAVEVEGVFEVR
jgi:hypothetical protein